MVPIAIVSSARIVSTSRVTAPVSSSGSSPCRFRMTCACGHLFATSATRSVPLVQLGEVISIPAPKARATLAMRSSSVAITSSSMPRAARARFPDVLEHGLPPQRGERLARKTRRAVAGGDHTQYGAAVIGGSRGHGIGR
jgi:hypothetical protein